MRNKQRKMRRTPETPGNPLTPQQQKILELTKQGYKQNEIADQLGLSIHTVRFHTRFILARTGARTIFHAYHIIMQQSA